jgi:uncharacterized membrane protein YadS
MAKNKYTFIKKAAPAAKESIIFSSISLGMFALDVILSLLAHTNGGAILGALGLFAMLTAMYGFYLGIKAVSDKGSNYLITSFGTIYAGIMCILWVGMFFLGLSR